MCDRKIGPYPCCTVIQGDCLELAKNLPRFDVCAIITDPPYGIDVPTDYASAKRGGKDYAKVHGDDKPFDPSPWLGFPRVVLFGANHFASRLPDMDSWLVWHKRLPNNADRNDQADVELAWSNIGGPARHFQHTWNGFLRDSEVGVERDHPTQKPIALMEWAIKQSTIPECLILDPYAGSGTTLVAAKKLGRHFLGFEISLEYCDIARKRLAAVDAQPSLFQPQPEQLSL
jgi:site-specific DNA-methyltransferase (adenine-specific)